MELITKNTTTKMTNSLSLNLNNTRISSLFLIPNIFQLLLVNEKMQETFLVDLKMLLKISSENRLLFTQSQHWEYYLIEFLKSEKKSIFQLSIELLSLLSLELFHVKDGHKTIKKIIDLLNVVQLEEEEKKKKDSVPLEETNKKEEEEIKEEVEVEEKETNKKEEEILEEVEEEKTVESIKLTYLNNLMKMIEGNLKSVKLKRDEYFWNNLFQFLRLLEEIHFEYEVKNEKIEKNLLLNTLKLFDFLIKKSVKVSEAMIILHSQEYDSSKFTTIVKGFFTPFSSKLTFPYQSMFSILLRFQLNCLKFLSKEEIEKERHDFRLLALLMNDIKHERVPKIEWKSNFFTDEMNNQRIYYSLSRLFLGLEQNEVNLVEPTILLLKNNEKVLKRDYNAEWIEKLNEKISNSEKDFFILYSTEFSPLLESDPILTFMRECKTENIPKNKNQPTGNLKDFLKSLTIGGLSSNNNSKNLKSLITRSLREKQHLHFEELNRRSNWKDNQRRLKLM
jgi:hypothetical protein